MNLPPRRSNAILKIHNPATGALLAEVPEASPELVAERAAAARAAQPAWAEWPLRERMEVLQRFRVAVAAEVESLAATLTAEVGKPIRQSRSEANGLLPRIDFFLAQAEGAIGAQQLHDEGGTREVLGFDPLGVVANTSAWNCPCFVGGNVFVPALLAGNAVLYKPSEFATLTGLHIARLLHESGVPADVFAPLIGGGAVGRALLEKRIDGVFFTGSHATGQRIAVAVGARLIKLQLELGSKDAMYVADDADVRSAAESLADGAMYNTGQSCCSVERIYVHERIHDAFIAAFVETVKGFALGDPTSEDACIGAITRAPQLGVLDAQVADAKAKGATLLAGGQRVAGRAGNWYEPTVFGNVDHTMALMNDSRYGLTAGMFSNDEARATTILAKVNAGTVYWNCCDRVSPRLPWSEHGDSGVGLTLSTLGMQAVTRPRAWQLRQP